MVKPFQMQLMAPDLSNASFASQSMGSYLTSHPCLSATAFAKSRSKPVNSPSSPTYP